MNDDLKMGDPRRAGDLITERDKLRQAHARLQEENLRLEQQLATEREKHARDLLAKQTRIEILQEQLATERESAKQWQFECADLKDQLAAEREKLAAAQDLMAEVRQWHSDPDSNEYNDCDHNQCQWCESSLKLGTDCMDAHVRQKTWELQQQLAAERELRERYFDTLERQQKQLSAERERVKHLFNLYLWTSEELKELQHVRSNPTTQ